MSPIKGLSDIVRLPRLGHIHLGEKVTDREKTYCRALPHFVCPPVVQDKYGKTPTELDIVFPTENTETIAQQYLRTYSQSHGCVCIGDGVHARRKIDLKTGGIADHNTTDWEWRGELSENGELNCNLQECPEFLAKKCKKVLSLQFILPLVKGIGVWQLDTSSFYSIVNVNNMIGMLQEMAKHYGGRGVSWVPLKLRLAPMDVFPAGMKKKKANVLHIVREDVSLVEMLQPGKASALPSGEILAPAEAKQVIVAEPDADEAPVDFAPDGYLEPDDREAEAGSSQALAPFNHEDSPMKAWAEVMQLVKELNPTEERIQAWWKAAYNLEVSKADFKKQRPPDKLGGVMIMCFREKLMETKAYQKQTPLPS
jgi:hypothetical protein